MSEKQIDIDAMRKLADLTLALIPTVSNEPKNDTGPVFTDSGEQIDFLSKMIVVHAKAAIAWRIRAKDVANALLEVIAEAEALRKERDALREALREVSGTRIFVSSKDAANRAIDIADAALAAQGDKLHE